jgi:hypothetical protein
MNLPYLNASHFTRAEAPDAVDTVLFGDRPPAPAAPPEQAITRDAYLWFGTTQGQIVLNDLITRFIAAPIFDGNRDAAKGYERNGEANTVRHIIRMLQDAQQAIEQRRV